MTIPAGQISVLFNVPINDDNVFEENEEFLLTIDQSSSLNGVIIGSPNVAVVNISDNDGKLATLIYKFCSANCVPGFLIHNYNVSTITCQVKYCSCKIVLNVTEHMPS